MRVTPKSLEEYVAEILTKHSVPQHDAETIANSLVEADLRGISSHGVARLKAYIERVRAGLMEAVSNIQVLKRNPSTLLLDGGNGFGAIGAIRATSEAIYMAKTTGVGLSLVRNTNHFGIAAYYINKIAEEKLIGVAISNTPPAMSPVGGKKAKVGTNPLAIAVPALSYDPVILDMATSVVAKGKIRLAAKKGESIPRGWALDENGEETIDPQAALAGSLVGVGGYKGVGLSLMIELLTGVLTGGAWAEQLLEVTNLKGPSGTSFAICALNPEQFVGTEAYLQRVDSVIESWHSTPAVNANEKVFVPGELEFGRRHEALVSGIVLSEGTVQDLRDIGSACGVNFSVEPLNYK